LVLIGVCACLAALQGGQAGAGGAMGPGNGWGLARMSSASAGSAGGPPRYNAIDAEEGGHGNGLTRRQA
jgi:hypothetical protein